MKRKSQFVRLSYLFFSLIMFSLFCLQSFYCLKKILNPVIIKVSQQKFADKLEIPSLTICRKGFKNVSNFDDSEIAYQTPKFCPTANDSCIQNKLLYVSPEDFYIRSHFRHYFEHEVNQTLNVSYNIYSILGYSAVNCFVINHHDLLPTG